MTDARPCRVLLIQENSDEAAAFQKLLAPLGSAYATEWQSGLSGARDAIRQGAYDVLVLDQVLGRLSGAELLLELKGYTSSSPAILLTESSAEIPETAGLLSGFSSFLVKDSLSTELLDATMRHARVQHQRMLDVSTFSELDALTRLPNRRRFDRFLGEALSRAARHERKLAVVALAIEDFKDITIKYGHDIANRVLIEFAERVSGRLRATDLAARCGGEDFMVVADDIRQDGDAERIAKDLEVLGETPYEVAGQSVSIALKIGFAVYPRDAEGPSELVMAADRSRFAANASAE